MKTNEKACKPGFMLNCHDRRENPLFESHDPSMMYDPVSKRYYSYATDTAITSPYRQGIPVRRSADLVNFEFVGYALSDRAVAQGRDNGKYAPTPGFWAPYVEYACGEYRMYYSATRAFGSSESRIYLAVAAHPEGPFENRGVVMDTWGTDVTYPNAIDPHVIDDGHGGKYLVYGSFFGGIFLKELDPATGLCLSGNVQELGRRIARKPVDSYIDGPEGAAVIRNPHNGNFYLFLSYGWLGDDYDIRVGLSRTVEGPYRDMEGKNLDGESLGMKLAGSYCFHADAPYAAVCGSGAPRTIRVSSPFGVREEAVSDPGWKFAGFRGPGHGVPFYNEPEDAFYFVHHVRDGAAVLCREPKKEGQRRSYRMHYLTVRRMCFINDWPVFSPEPFAGEREWDGTVRRLCVRHGVPVWEGTDGFEETAVDPENSGGPENSVGSETAVGPESSGDLENSVGSETAVDPENPDSFKETGDGAGAWEWIVFSNTDNEMAYGSGDLTLGDVTAVMGEAFDYENGGMCRVLSGYTDDGRSVWGKRR